MTTPDVVAVDLTEDERYVLRRGLGEWGGPAHATEELARAMGFLGVGDLLSGDGRVLRDAVDRSAPLSRTDWRRALLATEIVFVSDVVGAGWDWCITVGLSDEETIRLLRSIQRKIARALHQD